jgi:hypothetical protein
MEHIFLQYLRRPLNGYLTNELDEKKLPTAYVVALYWQRWRDDVVAYLANEARFFGFLKRKRKDDNPSPLDFVPKLLTELSKP